jgi:hypothetical protein
LPAQDFCYLTGTPLEQYAIYKQQWQQSNRERFSAPPKGG